MKTQYAKARNAFTLIELLVVIAIIAILAAILFPVFAQAREQARTSVCVSNTRQIGMAVGMYAQDYDETMPIFYSYNTQTPHKGVEVLVLPYTKDKNIFRCPDDQGGPAIATDCPNLATKTYHACYGSSYRFDSGSYSVIAGESSANNAPCAVDNPYCLAHGLVRLASFTATAETRIMRDEMFPWFGTMDKYGYTPGYYQQWHSRGGGVVFADGHSKFVVSSGAFDNQVVCPAGQHSGDTDPNAPGDLNPYLNPIPTYYGICD